MGISLNFKRLQIGLLKDDDKQTTTTTTTKKANYFYLFDIKTLINARYVEFFFRIVKCFFFYSFCFFRTLNASSL